MTDELNEGDEVVCVDDSRGIYSSMKMLTLGKHYFVTKRTRTGRMVQVQHDRGERTFFGRSRFEKVGPPAVIEVLY